MDVKNQEITTESLNESIVTEDPKKTNESFKRKLIPVFFGIGVFLFDQITKWLVITYIPLYTIRLRFFGDFLQIIHVRNLGAAFSIGGSLPQTLRSILLAAIPVVILIIVMVVYFRNNSFTWVQRWFICGVAGGGFGNLFDRIFREDGVVDFIDVKFFGLFGFERFPTFNMADSFIMVCGILLMISFFTQVRKERKANKNEKPAEENKENKTAQKKAKPYRD
ncbi:MAG: signal peptidase II [Treponemataceae bacterium]|nr:signal peptidase II [Treponemataceae bacterium]